MNGLFATEIRGLARGYELANSCGLLPETRLLEAFPISADRFVFLLEATDLGPAQKLCAGHPMVTIASPHPLLLKSLFNLQSSATGEGLAVLEGRCFPDSVMALQMGLEQGLLAVDVRYGKLLQGCDLLLLTGAKEALESFRVKISKSKLALEVRILSQLAKDLKAIL